MIGLRDNIIQDFTDREEAMSYILNCGGRIEEEIRDGISHYLVVV